MIENTSSCVVRFPGRSTTLGHRLAIRRTALGMTQADVVTRTVFWNDLKRKWVQLGLTAYIAYESGYVVPDVGKIEQLATVLECRPAWLAFNDGEP